jgi:hypothetical protein
MKENLTPGSINASVAKNNKSGSLGIAVIVTPAVTLPPELPVHHGDSQ